MTLVKYLVDNLSYWGQAIPFVDAYIQKDGRLVYAVGAPPYEFVEKIDWLSEKRKLRNK